MLSDRPTVHRETAGHAAVSSAHHLATAAGIEILESGGNVIDAAVAISFALGVVEPDASGIGGYGEMVLYLQGMERPTVIEFLSRVPESAGLNNAAYVGDRLPLSGPVLANVPGTVRGMELAWERYGSGEVEWGQLLQPAIRLAEEGFVLDEAFTTTLSLERAEYLEYESSKELFFPEGEPLRPGDLLKNPGLAWTLRQIADRGADAFYEGEVARRVVEDLRGKGNAMTLNDMARYFAVEREPVAGTYRGHSIYSAVPAAGGGVSLVSKLHLLDNTPPFGFYAEDAAALHALIEAWKLTPSTRGRLADPSLWPVDIEPLIDRQAAAERWGACFNPTLATGPDDLETDRDRIPACARVQEELASLWGEEIFACQDSEVGCKNTGTTAFAVADADGNIVAVTQTLGTWGGNFYVTPELGFLYNDKLRSYGSDPDSYGARLPYARHGTSIAPTLVFKGTGDEQRPLLAVGAAGNAWITSAVYQVVTGILDGDLGPQRALEAPRFLVGVRRQPGTQGGVSEIIVQAEDAISPEVLRTLRAMGHDIRPISLRGEMRMGYGAAVLIDDGLVRAGADPRRSGGAAAIQ
jgi:gamma-glutamyltranspeptidase